MASFGDLEGIVAHNGLAANGVNWAVNVLACILIRNNEIARLEKHRVVVKQMFDPLSVKPHFATQESESFPHVSS
jgi:hypothetical protein